MTKTMELKRRSERCYHLHLTNDCSAGEMSEMMTNKAHQALREIMAKAKNGKNNAGIMELSGAHIIDLMHAVSFASFKGNRQ